MAEVRFRVEMAGRVPVVVTPEEVDITNAVGLRSALGEAAGRGPAGFVVDMSRTRFCDTAGLHALTGAYKRAGAEGGGIWLVVTGAAVARIFAITGLDEVIPRFSSLDDALAAASGGSAANCGSATN